MMRVTTLSISTILQLVLSISERKLEDWDFKCEVFEGYAALLQYELTSEEVETFCRCIQYAEESTEERYQQIKIIMENFKVGFIDDSEIRII